jgi:hypothetical protein
MKLDLQTVALVAIAVGPVGRGVPGLQRLLAQRAAARLRMVAAG